MDFVIDKINGITSYHSTNMECPIYGYKANSTEQEAIAKLRKEYGDITYFTFANTGDDKAKRDYKKEDMQYIKGMREKAIVMHNVKNKVFMARGGR